MTLHTFFARLAGFGLALCIGASQTRISEDDVTFVRITAQGGMAEVALGQLAQIHAFNVRVKQFGRQMETDHTKFSDDLKGLAASKGIHLPDNIEANAEITKARLSRLEGALFDRAYMEEMVAEHLQDIDAFQKEAERGTDPDIKLFSSRALPALQQHLKLAQDVLDEVLKGTSK